jgi:uncharacterized protein (DUF58 family)
MRNIPATLAIGVRTNVDLVISTDEKVKKAILPTKIVIFDLYDDRFDCHSFPQTIRWKKNTDKMTLKYEVLPVLRGDWEFPACELLLSSPLHFWRLKVVHQVSSTGKTYPEFSELSSGADLRAVLDGADKKSIRKRGVGLEFKQLRDWQNGDSVRSIDWRATSRKNQLVIREYIEEQDQQVLLLLDSGYRLHSQTAGGKKTPAPKTQFDAALNAALLLSWVALKHGDSVSAGIFGNEERWVSPQKGVISFPRLINALYDAQSASVPSSIFSALEKAQARLKRRSFIICISNFREEDEEELSRILPVVGRRHLLLMVSLSENEAGQLSNISKSSKSPGKKPSSDEILTAAAATYYLAQRKKLYKKWEHAGILVLDTNSASLSSTLINNFISVKRKGLL